MPADPDRLSLLRAVPLFSSLDDREARRVLAASSEVEHRSGDLIVEEGQLGVAFHLILQGEAEVSQAGRVRKVLGSGQYFGQISLIDGGPRTATVRALTPLRALTLSSWEFRPLVLRDGQVAWKLLLDLCRLVRESGDESSELST